MLKHKVLILFTYPVLDVKKKYLVVLFLKHKERSLFNGNIQNKFKRLQHKVFRCFFLRGHHILTDMHKMRKRADKVMVIVTESGFGMTGSNSDQIWFVLLTLLLMEKTRIHLHPAMV